MKHLSSFLFLCLSFVLASAQISAKDKPQKDPEFSILVFTKTAGWKHKAIPVGITTINKLGQKNNFNVTTSNDANMFAPEILKNFKAIVFLNTTGDVLNDKQQRAMQTFIQAGNGFVGIHSAADTEYDWPWYKKLVGRHFVTHPETQQASVNIVARDFSALKTKSAPFKWADEWYDYGPENSSNLKYLMTIDESTYDVKAYWGKKPRGNGMGKFHPVAWYQKIDGGRSFYTGLGHVPKNYQTPFLQQHLYDAILWAALGKKSK